MKKLLFAVSFLTLTAVSFAQDEEQKRQDEEEDKSSRGFQIEKMFAGGSLNLGIGGGSFNIGANPQVGYSVANWLDVGVTTNIIYYSQRYDVLYNNAAYGFRERTVNYGGGPFIRICPISMVHLQAQYEFNWITGNVEDVSTGTKTKIHHTAPSVLIGAGYGRRIVGQSWFFTTVLFDVTKADYSPYVYAEGQSKISLPIVRAGFNVYFGRKTGR
jgi:hypothetical protein